MASVSYNRTEELKAFDDTKAGVKGLLDAGIVSIPKIFIRPPEELAEELNSCQKQIEVPIIDLDKIQKESRRKEIVDEIRTASEEWGFFRVINHGMPLHVLDEMIEGIRMFNEQDTEVKKEVYCRDIKKQVTFNTNYDLYNSRTANWRDTLTISSVSDDLAPEVLPEVCRKSIMEYAKYIRRLGHTLLELLSEALGLQADHLLSMDCAKESTLVCHYYPACPQPELTLGASRHTDPGFLTLLLQNEISGLQVLHDGQWFDVLPIQGGLVVNICDLLQIVSNDKFKSVEHRVIANLVGPRISVPCFFAGPIKMPEKTYSPIQELISEANPPRYKEIRMGEYIARFQSASLDENSHLDFYKI